MNRREVLGLAAAAACLPASRPTAAETNRVYRVGFLAPGNDGDTKASGIDGLIDDKLRELGYVEGRNLVWIRKFARNDASRLTLLAAELAAANVDVIVAGGTPATQAAQKATSTIPIVAGNVTDPVKFAMTTSLARPSANVTGTGNMGAEISGKRLDILRALVPNARRVGIFVNLDNPANAITPAGAQRFRDAGLEIIELGVRKPAEIEPAFRMAQSRRARVVQIPTDGLFNGNTQRMAQLALAYRLASLGGFCRFVRDGGLASFGVDYEQIWRQAGEYVGRILKGAKPAELPFVLGDKFDFCVNRKTAAALGLTIAPELLVRADLVVE